MVTYAKKNIQGCRVMWNIAFISEIRARLLRAEKTKNTGLILGLRPANAKRRYFVTTSLIGWMQSHNWPCKHGHVLKLLPKSHLLI